MALAARWHGPVLVMQLDAEGNPTGRASTWPLARVELGPAPAPLDQLPTVLGSDPCIWCQRTGFHAVGCPLRNG
jgi:hypothetical protein